MITNILETNVNEAKELLNLKLFFTILLYGVLPCAIFKKIQIEQESIKTKAIIICSSLLFLVIIMITNYKNFLLLKSNRFILNYLPPYNYTFNTLGSIAKKIYIPTKTKQPLINISDDSEMNLKTNRKNLIIYVIGEATRADHLGFNGYERNTTEFLDKYNVINFSNFYSCNTSTFNSIPCMFSFDKSLGLKKSLKYENYLDIFKKFGFELYWISNNGGCKGVCSATNFTYLDSPKDDDMDLLMGLGKMIDNISADNAIIYLHMRGNHGQNIISDIPLDLTFISQYATKKKLEVVMTAKL
jgi:lipid A ethanolaminephosphotransferase